MPLCGAKTVEEWQQTCHSEPIQPRWLESGKLRHYPQGSHLSILIMYMGCKGFPRIFASFSKEIPIHRHCITYVAVHTVHPQQKWGHFLLSLQGVSSLPFVAKQILYIVM